MSFDAHGAVQGAPTPQPTITSTSAPAPESKPKVEPAATVAPSAAPAADPAATPAPEVPKWEPNHKFKVMDKEYEIDEFVRGVITDAEKEKKIKELYEKAYGLDVVKPRFNQVRDQYKQLNETHTQVMGAIQDLREHYTAGDFDSFFQKLNIPVEKVLQWVIDKAQYHEMTPEQKRIVEARQQAQKEAYDLRKQNQMLSQQYEAATGQAKVQALQVALEKPDVMAFASKFDAANVPGLDGQPISFRDAVIEIGETAWQTSQGKVDLTPEQAVQLAMQRYAFLAQVPQAPAAAPVIPVSGGQPAAAAAPAKAPTIPNVSGRSTSSVAKQKPKSIEDLKKLAAAMQK